MLSTYTVSQVGYFGANATGAEPRSTLVEDANGDLFGTSYAGGAYGCGTVFEVAQGSNAMTVIASFNGTDGQSPIAGLTLDASGNLYGTTQLGGVGDNGTVFEIARGSNTITTLVAFNGTDGSWPYGGLTFDASGNLYGTTAFGGQVGDGTVFEIAQGSNTLSTIATFFPELGVGPHGGVTLDASGDLYGTTDQGGANGDGTLFEVARGSNTVTALALFNGTNGTNPQAGLVADATGNLFGTTEYGGANNDGTVFEVASGSTAITTLASFNGANGSNPLAALTLDESGDLFGTTEYGGGVSAGTAYEMANGSNTITTIASFYGSVGQNPYGAVMLDASGNLYGTTSFAGAGSDGTVYEIAAGSNVVTVLAAFDMLNGQSPYAGVTLDASGDVFGTTMWGGISGLGTVYEIPEGTTTAVTLTNFNSANGKYPEDAPAVDALGNVFGTTSGGGANNYGTVFEIARGSNTVTTLASFRGINNRAAFASVVLDASDDVYGITDYGGASGDGTVFEIATGSNTMTTLASFNGSNGNYPQSVTLDPSGNLYGTTGGGGAYNDGTVFEIASGSMTITTIASFNGIDGTSANPGLTLDAAGNLYGTTEEGGASNYGTAFEIARGSTTVTTLASFDANHPYPASGVAVDAAGNLYGTTYDGGDNGAGTVYEVSGSSHAITTLASLPGHPQSVRPGVRLDTFGNLYGTTDDGGADRDGSVFELAANTAITLAPAASPNPAHADQPLNFTATMSGSVPDGEPVTLVDASNNNAVVATGTLAGGSATLTVPAGTLAVGTHNLIAAYGGDANFAASESAAYAQVVQPDIPTLVGAPVINGDNPNGLFNAAGQGATPGVQRSMVEDVVYRFSDPVTIPNANAAFTVQVAGSLGTVPSTLLASAVPGTNGTQWAVSLTGQPVGVLASIANGEYRITLNPGAVFAAADGTTAMAAGETDTFYRLYGDINGDRIVNNADNLQFRRAQASYDPAFDYNADGFVNNADNLQLRSDQAVNFFSDGFVTSI